MHALLANVAIPLFFPHPVLMMLALLPVVAIETSVIRRRVSIRTGDIFLANVYSTLWGIPLAYITLGLFGFIAARGEAPWAAAGFSSRVASTGDHHWWILPLATLVVIIPCFLLSVHLESRFLTRRSPDADPKSLFRMVVRANCFSYLALLGFDFLWFSLRIR
jgi:hypothetical protein